MTDRDSGTEQCPICGQQYDHYREVGPDERHILRSDATECKRVIEQDSAIPTKKTYGVFVHV